MTSFAGSEALGYSLRYKNFIISEMKRVFELKYNEISETIKKYFPLGWEQKEIGKIKILINLSNNYNNNKPNEIISLVSTEIKNET